MSWLSKATGIHIKVPGLSQVGDVLQKAAPAIGGAVLGSSAGDLLGRLTQGGGLAEAAKGAAGDLGKAAAGAAGVIGLPAVAGAIPGISEAGGFLSHIPGASSIADFLKGAAGKIPGVLSDALSHPLETAGIVSSALDQAKARGLQTEALNDLRSDYDSRSGLRTKGVAGLMNPTAPDLSGIGYDSPSSVYGRRKIPGVS